MTIETTEGSPVMEAALALLQSGLGFPCRPGSSAREFMHEALGLDDAYIEGVISTIFIDSEPVDDIDAARVGDGSVLALSAAMPGLVGAVMRRNSPYASFRKGISYDNLHMSEAPSSAAAVDNEGITRVKFFNQVMRDLGAGLFSRGVYLAAAEARGLAELAGVTPPTGEKPVFLRVVFKEAGSP